MFKIHPGKAFCAWFLNSDSSIDSMQNLSGLLQFAVVAGLVQVKNSTISINLVSPIFLVVGNKFELVARSQLGNKRQII